MNDRYRPYVLAVDRDSDVVHATNRIEQLFTLCGINVDIRAFRYIVPHRDVTCLLCLAEET